jgi:hypothetical protein
MPILGSEIMQALKSDLVNDVNVIDFCESKELWFLQNISRRNRLRLILMASSILGLKVATQIDLYCHVDDPEKNIAIEAFGVETESIYKSFEYEFDQVRGNKSRIDTIQHLKGCVDISKHKGIIPVHIGYDYGYQIIIPPDYPHDTMSAVSSDCKFVSCNTFNQKYLFPVINWREKDMNSRQRMKNEQLCIPHLKGDSMLLASSYSGIELDRHITDLLKISDIHGIALFYGIQYQTGPGQTLMCPNIIPNFIHNRVPKNENTAHIVTAQPQQESTHIHQKLTPSDHVNYNTVADCINKSVSVDNTGSFFSFDTQTCPMSTGDVVLEWESSIIECLEYMHGIHGRNCRYDRLVPVCYYEI